jgi:hypothetical protein
MRIFQSGSRTMRLWVCSRSGQRRKSRLSSAHRVSAEGCRLQVKVNPACGCDSARVPRRRHGGSRQRLRPELVELRDCPNIVGWVTAGLPTYPSERRAEVEPSGAIRAAMSAMAKLIRQRMRRVRPPESELSYTTPSRSDRSSLSTSQIRFETAPATTANSPYGHSRAATRPPTSLVKSPRGVPPSASTPKTADQPGQDSYKRCPPFGNKTSTETLPCAAAQM